VKKHFTKGPAFLLPVIVILFLSCGKNDGGDFDTIVVNGGNTVTLSQGSETKIEKFGKVSYSNKNGVLTIHANPPGIVNVTVKDLKSVTANDGATINSASNATLTLNDVKLVSFNGSHITLNMKADDVTLEIEKKSDITLSGTGTTLTIKASEEAKYHGCSFVAGTCSIEASGGSVLGVNVTGGLDLNLTSDCEVSYNGLPSITNQKGIGTVLQGCK
jgi:hypothetical protein